MPFPIHISKLTMSIICVQIKSLTLSEKETILRHKEWKTMFSRRDLKSPMDLLRELIMPTNATTRPAEDYSGAFELKMIGYQFISQLLYVSFVALVSNCDVYQEQKNRLIQYKSHNPDNSPITAAIEARNILSVG